MERNTLKYTDSFFEIPIRIYDRFSVLKSEEEEKATEIPQEGDWIMGKKKLLVEEISDWVDFYDSSQGIEGVKKEGYQYTLINTYNIGSFVCIWDKDKFEKKLNEFMEKFESTEIDLATEIAERLKESLI